MLWQRSAPILGYAGIGQHFVQQAHGDFVAWFRLAPRPQHHIARHGFPVLDKRLQLIRIEHQTQQVGRAVDWRQVKEAGEGGSAHIGHYQIPMAVEDQRWVGGRGAPA